MRHSKTIIISVLIALLILVLAFPVIYFTGVFRWTDKTVREKLNNPYIDGDYAGWRKVKLEGAATLLIPNEWELIIDRNNTSIMEGDRIIAKGFRVQRHESGDSDSLKKETEEWLTKEALFYPFDIVERDVSSLTVTNMGNAADYMAVICIGANGEKETHYTISLDHAGKYRYCFDFGVMDGVEDPLFDYIEAIAYSYKSEDNNHLTFKGASGGIVEDIMKELRQ